jgi:serine protease AprX
VATNGDLAGRVVPVADPQVPDGPAVECVNFSGERSCDDTFGHGTFLAGIITGNGSASGGSYAGVAPGAQIVSVKVGGADGSADVSKVLAAIQWVVSFADLYDIRVLNLSMGTDSTVSPHIDPLNLAVQRAWVQGITVVVSAGNFGRPAAGASHGTVTKPGDDPFVITVGAIDDEETTTHRDDRLPGFSSWGPTAHGNAKPDIVAPGARLVSLRAPGSTVDGLPGIVDGTYRRGSGTSMSAAVVSGLAAQLLHAHPGWRPDDVKEALLATARPVASDNRHAVGAGLVDGPAALQATITPTQRTATLSSGLGSLLDSSGSNLVTLAGCTSLLTLCGVLAEETSQGNNWQGIDYAENQWSPQTWYSSQWVTGLSGNNWQTSTWATGNNWQGNNWQGSTWYGEADQRSYGTTTQGSASYGAWG